MVGVVLKLKTQLGVAMGFNLFRNGKSFTFFNDLLSFGHY